MLLHLATLSLQIDQLPTRFERSAFERFASSRPSVLANRLSDFVRVTAPLQLEAARLFAAGRLRRDDAAYARSTRDALAELGPTFIKIGQILSVREDVLGPVWAAELASLQNGVEPAPSAVALVPVYDAFGCDAFVSIEADPVACASLAQVHRAKWRADDGTTSDVAVKVLRPGVIETIAVDLCVLLRASELLGTWAPRLFPASEVDFRTLLVGLASALWEEVDLNGEAEREMAHRLKRGARDAMAESGRAGWDATGGRAPVVGCMGGRIWDEMWA
jgi:predicted unusual protein kinase regulating ubiquinone biosynthesis (AarF/ABC1/UbiB family)